MGFWPDWWPANPVGSAYDEWQERKKEISMLIWVLGGLAAVILVIYLHRKWSNG